MKLFEIIRSMYELQKIEIWVEKITFPCFYIFAFCSLTDRLTDKIFIEYMLIYERNVQRKFRTLSQLGAEKIVKHGILTGRQK